MYIVDAINQKSALKFCVKFLFDFQANLQEYNFANILWYKILTMYILIWCHTPDYVYTNNQEYCRIYIIQILSC